MRGILEAVCCLLLSLQLVEVVPEQCMVDGDCRVAFGGDAEVTLTCQTGERSPGSQAVDWFHNGELVDTSSTKYELNSNQDRLDIHDIVGTDEGQYACSYESSSGNTTTVNAECLIVYGRGYYKTCSSPGDSSASSSCTDDTVVSSNGTIHFDLSIVFYETGCSGHHQNVSRISVRRGNSLIYSCTPICSDHVNRWWTVDNTRLTNIALTLHQALSSDRGEYKVETELDNAATGASIHRICKVIRVTAPSCDSPPQVENATMSTLESTFIFGSQVNYSCDEGCTRQGNDSLRCGVQDVARWPDPPTCSCPGTSALDHPPAVTSIAITPTSVLVMTPPVNQVSEDNGSTQVVAVSVSVSIIVLLLITGAGAGAVAGYLLWHKRLTNQKLLSTRKVMVRTNGTNGHYSHDGPHRESIVDEGVTLGSGDEEYEFEGKNSQAVDV